MAIIQLPPDCKEFLQLLNAYDIQYLIIGGYAVGYYGYQRANGRYKDLNDIKNNLP
jgi:hypothetical protein